MTNLILSLSAPPPQPKREIIFGFRVTAEEREAIHCAADRLQVPDGTMARHIVMQAVQQFNGQSSGEEKHIDE